jgi:nucleoid DNA-binding protein
LTPFQPPQGIRRKIEAFITEVSGALAKGEKVDLRGFGNFVAREKKARQGRNPKTGETIEIAARKAVAFKPSKELATKVNGEPAAAPAA